jgi:hypothetical protein
LVRILGFAAVFGLKPAYALAYAKHRCIDPGEWRQTRKPTENPGSFRSGIMRQIGPFLGACGLNYAWKGPTRPWFDRLTFTVGYEAARPNRSRGNQHRERPTQKAAYDADASR